MLILSGSKVFDDQNNEYEVRELIGSGGFGNVFKLTKENSVFALKVLQPTISDVKDYKSFVNEAKNAVEIDHKNVIKYLFFNDSSQFQDFPPYIIMEYANGGSLRDYIKQRNDFLTNEELDNIFIQLVNGMEAISATLVHRDIKPENILLADGIIKITDFGLSKFVTETTRHTTFKGWGSLPYIAPEAWQFEKNTIQMDMYSMGIVFYELACLKYPYNVIKGDYEDWKNIHYYQVAENIQNINPNISPIISRLILQLLEKDSSKRPKNWNEIKELMTKNNFAIKQDAEIIKSILIKRNEKIQKATEERLTREKREKKIIESKNLILSQYHTDIISPIKNFIDEINESSYDEKIIYHFDSNSFLNTIHFGNNEIKIDLRPVEEETQYRINVLGRKITNINKAYKSPTINQKKIIAWGYIRASGKGFNIILLEKEESIYGNWLFLFNRHNTGILRNDDRPEPFPFEFSEITEEINYLNASHIFVSERSDYDLQKIKNFLVDYF